MSWSSSPGASSKPKIDTRSTKSSNSEKPTTALRMDASRCLGGTSTRWGGALIPFMAGDFDVAAGWDARWPVGVEAFTQYAPQVERIFELTETP